MRECNRAGAALCVRLSAWAGEYVETRSAETGTTKTEMVVEAISCVRAEHVQALMREGYEEMRDLGREMAEEDLAASGECVPEW